MERFLILLFFAVFSVGINVDFGTNSSTKQDCPICELDDTFNSQTNYSCFTLGLGGMTICTCPDGQYTVNSRCRLCDRPDICGPSDNTHCSEIPTTSPPGYVCFCPNNQFAVNKPCSDPTTTTARITTTTTNQPVLKPYDYFSSISSIMNVLVNATVAERNLLASYGKGAAAVGVTLRSIGIHRVRFLIERMYLNRKLFIGVYSFNAQPYSGCYIIETSEIVYVNYVGGRGYCGTSASGWFGNDAVAIRGYTFNSSKPAESDYTDNYEQYYMTNDIVTLTMNCEEGTLTLNNERSNKSYRMFIDPVHNNLGQLPWLLYINLYYPGDKIRFLPLDDD